jgi:hypothetical protein
MVSDPGHEPALGWTSRALSAARWVRRLFEALYSIGCLIEIAVVLFTVFAWLAYRFIF